jgi:hypothetical protein
MLTSTSDDWSKFTDYRGYEITDEVIQWFWQCVRSWPAERKSRLLQFATGTSRIPVNGFKDLQGSDGPRRFTIEKSGDPSQLPKSHTCFNRIDLPPYRDYATLENKLTLAVECVYNRSVSRCFYLPLLQGNCWVRSRVDTVSFEVDGSGAFFLFVYLVSCFHMCRSYLYA